MLPAPLSYEIVVGSHLFLAEVILAAGVWQITLRDSARQVLFTGAAPNLSEAQWQTIWGALQAVARQQQS